MFSSCSNNCSGRHGAKMSPLSPFAIKQVFFWCTVSQEFPKRNPAKCQISPQLSQFPSRPSLSSWLIWSSQTSHSSSYQSTSPAPLSRRPRSSHPVLDTSSTSPEMIPWSKFIWGTFHTWYPKWMVYHGKSHWKPPYRFKNVPPEFPLRWNCYLGPAGLYSRTQYLMYIRCCKCGSANLTMSKVLSMPF